MKIKNLIDTSLISFCMIAPITPSMNAKMFVVFFFILLSLRILFTKDIFYFINSKILITLLLFPGMISAMFFSAEALFRFMPFLLIVFAFPFSNFKINLFPIIVLSILILFYLIYTQVYLSYGTTQFIDFRENWYPFEYAEKFNSGYTDSIFKLLIEDDRKLKDLRFGGLYHNPNTLAGIILMYYIIFDILFRYFSQLNNHKKKIFLNFVSIIVNLSVILSLLLANSRTIIVGFIFFQIYRYFNLKKILQLNFNLFSVILFLVTFVVFLNVFESLYAGIFNERGSFNYKLVAMINYIMNVNAFNLLFGGVFNSFFDQEYGYWLGSSGLIGLSAFYVFFKMMIRNIPSTKLLILIFLTIGLGATVFYNFMMVSIIISLLIINASIHYKKINTKL